MFQILGGLLGGALQSSAVSSAAGQAAAASNAAVAENRRQYDENKRLEAERFALGEPFRQASRSALAQYLREMGLPYQQALQIPGMAQSDTSALRASLLPQYTTTTAATPARQVGWDSSGNGEGQYIMEPGTPASSTIDEAGLAQAIAQQQAQQQGQGATDFTTAPQSIDPTQDPGYQFGLQQGQQALDRKTAAQGGRISGAALKAAQRYGTDYATTGYNAAYQRGQNRLNRLSQLAGYGYTPAQTGQQPLNNSASIIQQQGNNAGAASLAQGNIWGNTLNQISARIGSNTNPGGTGISPSYYENQDW